MRRPRKPSPALVVACISLFIGLGGTSFAAVTLARNSVLSKHIKNGQVKTADLGTNAVNSAKVGDGSLLAQDFAAGQLPAGPQGPQGGQGPQGPETTALWAVIRGDTGAVVRGSGIGLTFKGEELAGAYELTWGTNNISNCAYVGTLFDRTTGRGGSGPVGEIGIKPLSTSPTNGLAVTTTNSAGGLADHDFSIAIFC